MKLFHRTTLTAAKEIVRSGFRDGSGIFLTDNANYTGVWLSDRPLDSNEGADGDALLEVIFDSSHGLEEFEWIEEGKGYREWLVPAHIVNERAKFKRIE